MDALIFILIIAIIIFLISVFFSFVPIDSGFQLPQQV